MMDEQLVDPNLIAEIKAVQQGRAQTQPGAVPAKGGFDLGTALPGIMMGLGEVAGGVAHGISGGRYPNVASQFRAMNDQRAQTEVENQQRQQAMKVAQDRVAMEKLKTGWDFMKEVAERLGEVDEETGKKLAPMFAERMGVPELQPLLEKTLTNTGLRDTVEKTFPAIVQRIGPAEAVKMFRKPEMIPRLQEMEKKLGSENAFNQLASAVRAGLVNKDVTPEQLDTLFPGMYEKFDKDQIGKLNQLGLKNFKTKDGQESKTGDQVFVEAAKKIHPDDPVKQAEAIKEFRRNPEGPTGRVFDILSKGDKATAEEKGIVQRYQDFLAASSGARAEGSKEGELRVRSGTKFKETERDIARERSEGSTEGRPVEASTQQALAALSSLRESISILDKNLDTEFLGPIKGTAKAFEARRAVGSYLNAPVGKKETTFRQTLANISDQLLRARSGAQINEQEYTRLSGLLPKATDEPQVFKAGVERFKKEMAQLESQRLRFGTTPRGKLAKQPSGGGSDKEDRLKNLFGD